MHDKLKQLIIKTAFIDDGINPKFIPPHIPFQNYTAGEAGVCLSEPVSGISHGTMCYQIFNNNVNVPYRLTDIKVLDNTTGTGSHKALVSALNWCASQNFDIINMSMGTRQYTDFAPIAAAVSRINKSIIIAACSNENQLTFPACLPSVIGVRHSSRDELASNFAYFSNPYDQIEIVTCVKDEPVSFGENIVKKMSGANSFATPLITARICNYFSQGYKTLDAIKMQLERDSVKDTSFASYDFYKNRTLNWEECTVPIVAVPDTVPEADRRLKELLNVFVQDGYRAIALSKRQETNAAGFIYNFHWHGNDEITLQNLIELHYNFALPDLIFLQMPTEDIITLPENLQPDIALRLPATDMGYITLDEKYVLELTNSAGQLFANIVELLS
ncbi:MAG: S8 family serine peptidase [Firmicutes bacterium]|nr:S8 family serine peptidase [Bacillota bacterium]